MKGLLKIFSPAPHLNEITDPEVVDRTYKYWRLRTLYSMFFGYAFYYFTRKSFTSAMPGLMQDLHFDKEQLGILSSILSISYGLSKFASGILSDKSNPRYFMAIGLIITGVLNILFGFSSTILFFALFWGLNGWFQGFGWPPCARLLTHWYSQSERGSWWSTWNVSHNVGAFMIPWIVGFCMQYWGWRSAMIVPGLISILGGLFLINRLRDTPQSLGLPPIEKFRNDGECSKNDEDERELTTKEILVEHVIKNPYIWLLGLAYFFVYFVRQGVNEWTVLYMMETKGYSQFGANGFLSLFEAGGLFGSLSAGWFSDYFFKARRGPVNFLFAFGMLLSIMLLRVIPPGNSVLDSCVIFLVGFMIFGPQMLIGVAAAELSHKKAAATSTGFIGYFAYLGAATAGYPLGVITQKIGWEGFLLSLVVCSALSVLLLIPLWNVNPQSRKNRMKKQLSPQNAAS